MGVVKFVLSIIGIVYGLKWILQGVKFITANGRPLGSNVIALQLAFVIIGIIILISSVRYQFGLLF